MTELRFYTFVNFYLSSIQQGVQSFHVLHEMMLKYPYDEDVASGELPEAKRFYDWAKNHKTVILLNGGAHDDIRDIELFFKEHAGELSFPAPFAAFYEDDKSLNGMMTAVAIVLPKEIYDAVDYRKVNLPGGPGEIDKLRFFFVNEDGSFVIYEPETIEHELIKLLKSCSLAR